MPSPRLFGPRQTRETFGKNAPYLLSPDNAALQARGPLRRLQATGYEIISNNFLMFILKISSLFFLLSKKIRLNMCLQKTPFLEVVLPY